MAVVGQQQDGSFIQSASFIGSREGYYFGTDSLGTGYYRLVGNGQDVSAKRKRDDVNQHQPRGEELLELVERQAGRVIKEIDEVGLERLLRALEKKFNANVERRIQYEEEPQKFMDSEVELDEAVKGLRVRVLCYLDYCSWCIYF